MRRGVARGWAPRVGLTLQLAQLRTPEQPAQKSQSGRVLPAPFPRPGRGWAPTAGSPGAAAEAAAARQAEAPPAVPRRGRAPAPLCRMGTVLSLSPASSAKGRRPAGCPRRRRRRRPQGQALGGCRAPPAGKGGKGESRLKRPSVLISALTWKRLVASVRQEEERQQEGDAQASVHRPRPPGPATQPREPSPAKVGIPDGGGAAKPLAVPVPTVPAAAATCEPPSGAAPAFTPPGSDGGSRRRRRPPAPQAAPPVPGGSPRQVIVQASLASCCAAWATSCAGCYRLRS